MHSTQASRTISGVSRTARVRKKGSPRRSNSVMAPPLMGAPGWAQSPAERTATPWIPARARASRSMASAMGLRQVLPVHTNNTFSVFKRLPPHPRR